MTMEKRLQGKHISCSVMLTVTIFGEQAVTLMAKTITTLHHERYHNQVQRGGILICTKGLVAEHR